MVRIRQYNRVRRKGKDQTLGLELGFRVRIRRSSKTRGVDVMVRIKRKG